MQHLGAIIMDQDDMDEVEMAWCLHLSADQLPMMMGGFLVVRTRCSVRP